MVAVVLQRRLCLYCGWLIDLKGASEAAKVDLPRKGSRPPKLFESALPPMSWM